MKPLFTRTTTFTTTFTTTTTFFFPVRPPLNRRPCRRKSRRSEETSSRRRRCRANNNNNNNDDDDDFDDGNDDVKALRDEASRGCSECYFPREKDRAENVFNACFPAFIRSKPFGTALLVGAETGEVVERFVSSCAAFEGEGAKLATVVDVSEKQLDRAMEKVPDVGISGNEKGAKYFQLSEMSLEEVKPYFGPFDAIVFNDTFEQFPEKKRKETLARAANLLKQTTSSSSGSDEGGVNEATSRIVISSRETREGDESYARLKREELEALVKGLPLAWTEEEAKRGKALDLSSDSNIDNRSSSSNSNSNSNNNNSIGNNNVQNDDNDLDATRVLYLTENYKLAKPLHMRAKVVRGFGRGSAEMGLPTANLDPAEISLNWQKELNDDTVDVKNIPLGVYFGYCQLEGDESGKKIAVLNVGRRPSFVDKKNYENDVTVEVHCVEKNEDGLAFENGKKQFYGETMSVECLGFVRPEMKFNGLDELVTRIKTDVGLSKNSLMKMGI